MHRHTGCDDPFFEKQDAFYEEGRLVVEQMVPPLFRDKLRQDNCYDAFFVFATDLFYVFKKRLDHRPVGRFKNDELDPHALLVPFGLDLLCLHRV